MEIVVNFDFLILFKKEQAQIVFMELDTDSLSARIPEQRLYKMR